MAADLTEPRCASERGLAMGGGRPAERRFTVGGSGKSVARCHRTVLAYWKFETLEQAQPDSVSSEYEKNLGCPLYAGVMAGFQVPVATAAQRIGGARTLAAGTAVLWGEDGFR